MTRDELVLHVAQRLGDTSQNVLDDLISPLFDRVLEELALNGCISQLKKSVSFNFVEGLRQYDTNTLTGLPATRYPLDVTKLLVPSWGFPAGLLIKASEQQFDEAMLLHNDSAGDPVEGQPRLFRLYPNEQTLEVDPVPSDTYAVPCTATFIAPPGVLAGGDNIVELQPMHIPGLVAGMLWHGAPFQDETLPDRKTQRGEFELLMLRLKQHQTPEIGREKRTAFRDF